MIDHIESDHMFFPSFSKISMYKIRKKFFIFLICISIHLLFTFQTNNYTHELSPRPQTLVYQH